jgi:hypothetical protein
VYPARSFYTQVVVRWLFLLAYTCSGLAGLIYEVSWTRLLTLYIGHTTAAAALSSPRFSVVSRPERQPAVVSLHV